MPIRASLNRAVLAGAFVAAIVAAPTAFVTLQSSANYVADDCAAGESNDVFTDNCVPDVAPNVPGGAWPTVSNVAPPEDSGDITESTPGDPFQHSRGGRCALYGRPIQWRVHRPRGGRGTGGGSALDAVVQPVGFTVSGNDAAADVA